MSSTNYYHLNFELYPSPNPAATATDTGRHDLQTDATIWHPSRDASIFDSLPEHQSSALETAAAEGCLFSTAVATPGLGGKASRNESYQGGDSFNRVVGHKPAAEETEYVSRVRASGDQSLQPHTETKTTEEPIRSEERRPFTTEKDWRFGQVRIESFDMEEASGNETRPSLETDYQQHATPAASLGPVLGGAGQSTRARFISLEPKTTNAGWGIVHLYREAGGKDAYPVREGGGEDASEGSDGTILCIPAVPSYLTPNDFLGFVGETWNQGVSHYRMILTSRSNRYMVLMKFRRADRAREWRNAFDGRIFNSMEAEVCHVTFIKSITITAPGDRPRASGEDSRRNESFPLPPPTSTSSPTPHVSSSLRPFPPPTPNLIELPTCPVCLERMDDTSGLMTILCQHVFHCTCLQTWKGSGCPVCRATNPSPLAAVSSSASSSLANNNNSSGSMAGPSGAGSQHGAAARPFGSGVSNLCSVCDCTDDLWICLICGYVGCGRYKRGHAKEHWKETGHSFSLELETQHVWDYAKDMWVHRLLRDKGDGKVVELPRRQSEHDGKRKKTRSRGGGDSGGGGSSSGQAGAGRQQDDENDDGEGDDDDDDVVPRAKVEHLGVEYSHLLISQLESQRVYFEEMVSKAADKAAKATAAAEAATAKAVKVLEEMSVLREENKRLVEATVPGLERDTERERRRADKASELARNLGRSLQEEKKVSEGLMARISHMQEQMTEVQEQLKVAQAENAEMREMNRDLSMFISGQEKLRELQAEGQVDTAEVEAGTVSIPEGKKPGGKGKGRKR